MMRSALLLSCFLGVTVFGAAPPSGFRLTVEVRPSTGETPADAGGDVPPSIEVPNYQTVTNYVLQVRGQRFLFLPPAGWGVKSDPVRETVELTEANRQAVISIRHLPASGQAGSSALDAWKAAVRERYAKLRVVAEQTMGAGLGDGVALDLEPAGGGAGRAAVRSLRLPVSDGAIEFELRGSMGGITNQYVAFRRLLRSFRQ